MAAPSEVPAVKRFFNMLRQRAVSLSAPLAAASVVLVGDVGGTNSRLQLYAVEAGASVLSRERAPGKMIHEAQYLNGDFRSFDDVVEAFLASYDGLARPSTACLAVAGPVEKNAVNFTNRSWVIDGAKLEARFKIGRVRLINDFVANGYGLLTLDEASECVTLQSAPKVAGAPIACIGAGTGLGECFSTTTDSGAPYETFASEGGHADWAPRNALEVELLEFMKAKFGQAHRVSVERVISGPGLATAYEFFASRFPEKVVPEVHAAITGAGELQGKFISKHSAKGAAGVRHCELCALTMETFATAYGAEAGTAALKWIPLGGLYIAGGLTPKNLPLLEGDRSPFMAAFRDKGRLSPLLKRVPVYAVLAEDIGQRGAHLVAFRLLLQSQEEAQVQQATAATEETTAGDEDGAIEFTAIKHSLPWKGSYERKLVISPTEILTKDPASGSVTNRWPKEALCAATAMGGADSGRFSLKLTGRGPFCGMADALTFSAVDQAQRLEIINTLMRGTPENPN